VIARRTLLGFVVGAAAAVSACSFFSPYSGSGAAIRFTHQKHIKAGLDCSTCHEAIYDSTELKGRYLPKEKVCLGCHREQKDSGNCTFCHQDAKNPRTWPERDFPLKVNHSAHIERVKEDCRVCHKDLYEMTDRGPVLPPMAACLGCHDHQAQYDRGQCEACHNDLSRYPLRPVADFAHQGDWLHRHPEAARSSADTCFRCHEQKFCADCHAAQTVVLPLEYKVPERVDREFIHRIDFLPRHTTEAAADPVLCQRCHGVSFCEDCHTRQNLTPQGTNPKNPHPAGWALPGPQNHGAEAQRDIASCAACHDQGRASNCVSCHRVGGIGGNPHPPGWTTLHPQAEIGRNGMCVSCH